MNRLFRQSALMRPKWDERRGERTYGERTIEHAIAQCRDTYTPGATPPPITTQTIQNPEPNANAEETDDSPSPQPFAIGLGEFLSHAYPPAEAYVENILSSDGGGWIGGEGKLGKTFYAIEEALCLATAQSVCGRFAVL